MLDHYVTVLEVTDHHVVVGDPVKGKLAFALEEFEQKWRFVGVALRRDSPK